MMLSVSSGRGARGAYRALVAALLTSCSSALSEPADALAPTDGANPFDTTTVPDASAIDAPDSALPGCGDQFIALETVFPDAGRVNLCQTLTADGLAIDVSSCVPTFTTATGDGGLSLSVGGDGTAFSTLGATMLGVGLIGRGPPCTSPDGYCGYRTGLTPCRAVVTRAGRAGDAVEAEIREPCHLHDDQGVERLVVDRLRVRGVLRVRYELNLPSDTDATVGRATECGVP